MGNWHNGGCHCGAVKFQVKIESYDALDCNCSICSKKGFLHLIVPPDRFELIQGEDMLSVYQFNTGTAQHLFCRNCGIHAFYRPRSHPNDYDVNVRCLEIEPTQFRIQSFDGKNWEDHIQEITR